MACEPERKGKKCGEKGESQLFFIEREGRGRGRIFDNLYPTVVDPDFL